MDHQSLDLLISCVNVHNYSMTTNHYLYSENAIILYFCIDSQGHLVPGLLEYLADGVIPLLHTFYAHFFDPSSSHKEEERESEYETSAKIAKCLMVGQISFAIFPFTPFSPPLPLYITLLSPIILFYYIES